MHLLFHCSSFSPFRSRPSPHHPAHPPFQCLPLQAYCRDHFCNSYIDGAWRITSWFLHPGQLVKLHAERCWLLQRSFVCKYTMPKTLRDVCPFIRTEWLLLIDKLQEGFDVIVIVVRRSGASTRYSNERRLWILNLFGMEWVRGNRRRRNRARGRREQWKWWQWRWWYR